MKLPQPIDPEESYPRATGYVVRRGDRPWTEAERAEREAQLRRLVPDFEDRGGSVTTEPSPNGDTQGYWLRMRFDVPVTPTQHLRVVEWLRAVLAN